MTWAIHTSPATYIILFLVCVKSAFINLLPHGTVQLGVLNEVRLSPQSTCDESNDRTILAEYDGFALPHPQKFNVSLTVHGLFRSCQSPAARRTYQLLSLGNRFHVQISCSNLSITLLYKEQRAYVAPKSPEIEIILLMFSADKSSQTEASSTEEPASIREPIGNALSYKYEVQARVGLKNGCIQDSNKIHGASWMKNEGIRFGNPVDSETQTAHATLHTAQLHLPGFKHPDDDAALHMPVDLRLVLEEDRTHVGEDVNIQVILSMDNGALGFPCRLEILIHGIEHKEVPVTQQQGRTKVYVSSKHTISIPGKFLIEARATGLDGFVHQDFATVNILKNGSNYTALGQYDLTSSHQLGRPISRDCFRSNQSLAHGKTLNWTDQYFFEGDLESERLFDYTILGTTRVNNEASRLGTCTFHVPYIGYPCSELFLAGPGSVPIFQNNLNVIKGHKKRVDLVPIGFPWASVYEVECQEHWSGWQRINSVYYRMKQNSNTPCSVGCTRPGTSSLIQDTFMYDQLNHALIRDSFGRLSLSLDPCVLDTVEGPKFTNSQSGVEYYATLGRQHKISDAAAQHDTWATVYLFPYRYDLPLPFRAWTQGENIYISRCFGSLYHMHHEINHRLGIKHPKLFYILQNVTNVEYPTDPLDPHGIFIEDNTYSDPFDIMGCCAGDTALSSRILLGWTDEQNKIVLQGNDLTTSRTIDVILWPFDRPESKFNLFTVIIRRSNTEAVVCGMRTLSHWPLTKPGDLQAESNTPMNNREPRTSRENAKGIVCEYLRWNYTYPTHFNRSMMHMGLIHKEWEGEDSGERMQLHRHHSALKPSQGYYDHKTKILVLYKNNKKCDVRKKRTITNFYGYNDDWPFQETYVPTNTSESFEYASVSIITQAPPPGTQMIVTSDSRVQKPSYLSVIIDIKSVEVRQGRAASATLVLSWLDEDRLCSWTLYDMWNTTIASTSATPTTPMKKGHITFTTEFNTTKPYHRPINNIRALSCDGRTVVYALVWAHSTGTLVARAKHVTGMYTPYIRNESILVQLPSVPGTFEFQRSTPSSSTTAGSTSSSHSLALFHLSNSGTMCAVLILFLVALHSL